MPVRPRLSPGYLQVSITGVQGVRGLLVLGGLKPHVGYEITRTHTEDLVSVAAILDAPSAIRLQISFDQK